MSFANPLSRLSSIIRAPVMVHSASSTESDWFLPYDGPIEPPPPPTRHPFAAEISQPKAVPARSKAAAKPQSRERSNTGRTQSRSRSRDAKRKSQRSFVALDAGGGVGAYPAPDREKERSSVQSDFTFGASSAHARTQGSVSHLAGEPQPALPLPDNVTVSTSGKASDPPFSFANHPFRMHTSSPPPRSHTASASLSTPWVRTIASSPTPAPAPLRKRTLTYQPGLVSSFGSVAETRVGYRESGAFLDLDPREREKIRPTLLPPSLSLLGKNSTSQDAGGEVGELGQQHQPTNKTTPTDSYLGLRGQFDLRSHPYATATVPMRETRFGSVSTTTTTTGGTGKPPVPPRPAGLKLKSSLKPSMSTPELRVRIPASAPDATLRSTPGKELGAAEGGLGARMPRSAGIGSSAAGASASGGATGLEVRTLCDALIFARPRFRAHEITPPHSPERDEEAAKRASVVVGESGFLGLACFPRTRARSNTRDSTKENKQQGENQEFKTVAEVLRDRDQLEKEREQWNALSQGSLLNDRTRSISRSQSRVGGARVGGPRSRRETVTESTGETGSGWGTLKLKKSVEMLAASALSQGHGHGPQGSVSSYRRGGTQGSASSHLRGASGSVVSRAHSRAESWGPRVACGSRSGSSIGDDAPGSGGNETQPPHGGPSRGTRRPTADNYPVLDIRPMPTGDTHRARAPPAQPLASSGLGTAGPSTRAQQVPGNKLSSTPNPAVSQPAQPPPPSPGDSVIGLALSSASVPSVLPDHPFAQRAGAYPAVDPPAGLPTGPETIATRHRHPPRSSGSTERAQLDAPNHELRPSRSAPLRPTGDLPPLQMKFPPGQSKSTPPSEHPFVARPALVSTPSGDVQRMFESAMLKSAVVNSGREWEARRGSKDSGLGSSLNDHAIDTARAGGVRKVSGNSALAGLSARGSTFGPSELDEIDAISAPEAAKEDNSAVVEPGRDAPPGAPAPSSLKDSLSPGSKQGVLTRVSSGMIDPALVGMLTSPMLSHESSSSSFSSPRPLPSIDDIESLRGIFYRPSPVPHASRLPQNEGGSPFNEPALTEESNESDNAEDYGQELTEGGTIGGDNSEDWTFGRPMQHRQPLWEQQPETSPQLGKTPLRIDLAPGTPSPKSASVPLPRSAPASAHSHSYQDLPESVHDSDSGHSVLATSSERATDENLTFGFVRSAQVDTLDVSMISRPQSTALSLIDMYDYDVSATSSVPNTPLNYQTEPSPFVRPSVSLVVPDDSSLPPSIHHGADRLNTDFSTPSIGGAQMPSTVLPDYILTVDNQTSDRRSADNERSC